MDELIEISGLLAVLSFITSFVTGLMIFKFHVKWVNMKWHIWSSAAALIFALTHVIIIKVH